MFKKKSSKNSNIRKTIVHKGMTSRSGQHSSVQRQFDSPGSKLWHKHTQLPLERVTYKGSGKRLQEEEEREEEEEEKAE